MRLAQQYPAIKTPISTSLVLIGRYDVSSVDVLTIDIDNTGAALAAFQVRARGVGPSQRAHQIYKSTWADTDARVLDYLTAPDTLASGASTQMQINVASLESIELWAQAAGSTVIDLNAGGYAS